MGCPAARAIYCNPVHARTPAVSIRHRMFSQDLSVYEGKFQSFQTDATPKCIRADPDSVPPVMTIRRRAWQLSKASFLDTDAHLPAAPPPEYTSVLQRHAASITVAVAKPPYTGLSDPLPALPPVHTRLPDAFSYKPYPSEK